MSSMPIQFRRSLSKIRIEKIKRRGKNKRRKRRKEQCKILGKY